MMWPMLCVLGAAACVTYAQVPARPQLPLDDWWGPPKGRPDLFDDSITNFTIEFSDEMIEDLVERLTTYTPPPPALENTNFTYGFHHSQVEPWMKYWREKYDFKAREKVLNQFPQFKTHIQGLDIHFIRVVPTVPANTVRVPLLLMHGWPGSTREFLEAIPLLTTPRGGLVFEVIVPSLPGYGFSDAALRSGLGPAQVGVIMKNLMTRLGHDKFYVQGGDWGSIIGSAMATLFQDSVLGFHSNMLVVMNNDVEIRSFVVGIASSLEPLGGPANSIETTIVQETGYMQLLATRPDTIGSCLTDSPPGLACFVLEKFSTWTNLENRHLLDGGLFSRFSADQLLDNIMMYYVPKTMNTAGRLFAEFFTYDTRALRLDSFPTTVPTWSLRAPNEKLFVQPPNMMKFPNLLGITNLDDGGHFIAFELPELFVADVFKAVQAFRAFHEKHKK